MLWERQARTPVVQASRERAPRSIGTSVQCDMMVLERYEARGGQL